MLSNAELERPRRYGEPVPFGPLPAKRITLADATDAEIRVLRARVHAAVLPGRGDSSRGRMSSALVDLAG